MSAPNSTRVTGERRNLPVQKCLLPPNAAMGALFPEQHKDLLPGCLAGPDAGVGADAAQTVAGESPAAASGGPGSPREHPQVPGSHLLSPPVSHLCLQSCPSPVGWECWGASQVHPWGRQAQNRVDMDLVGAERSPTGEPRWGPLPPTLSHSDKEEGPVPLPAHPQPGHRRRVQGSDCGEQSTLCLGFPMHTATLIYS